MKFWPEKLVALVAVFFATFYGDLAQAQECLDRYKKNVADCAMKEMSRPGRDAYDTTFWEACYAKFKQDKDACSAAPSASKTGSGGACGAVRDNVEWILVRDAGARRSFETARSRGESLLESLMFAQRHNRDAQNTISGCRGDAERIAREILSGAAPAAQATGDVNKDGPTDLSCVELGQPANNYSAVMAKADPKSQLHQWVWTIPIKDTCKKPVRVKFCLRGSQGRVQTADHTYGPGYTSMSSVTFYEVTVPPGPSPVFLKCRLGERCELSC